MLKSLDSNETGLVGYQYFISLTVFYSTSSLRRVDSSMLLTADCDVAQSSTPYGKCRVTLFAVSHDAMSAVPARAHVTDAIGRAGAIGARYWVSLQVFAFGLVRQLQLSSRHA